MLVCHQCAAQTAVTTTMSEGTRVRDHCRRVLRRAGGRHNRSEDGILGESRPHASTTGDANDWTVCATASLGAGTPIGRHRGTCAMPAARERLERHRRRHRRQHRFLGRAASPAPTRFHPTHGQRRASSCAPWRRGHTSGRTVTPRIRAWCTTSTRWRPEPRRMRRPTASKLRPCPVRRGIC